MYQVIVIHFTLLGWRIFNRRFVYLDTQTYLLFESTLIKVLTDIPATSPVIPITKTGLDQIPTPLHLFTLLSFIEQSVSHFCLFCCSHSGNN